MQVPGEIFVDILRFLPLGEGLPVMAARLRKSIPDLLISDIEEEDWYDDWIELVKQDKEVDWVDLQYEVPGNLLLLAARLRVDRYVETYQLIDCAMYDTDTKLMECLISNGRRTGEEWTYIFDQIVECRCESEEMVKTILASGKKPRLDISDLMNLDENIADLLAAEMNISSEDAEQYSFDNECLLSGWQVKRLNRLGCGGFYYQRRDRDGSEASSSGTEEEEEEENSS